MDMVDLKAFRKANNLTQDELGEYLGMRKSFISKIENGKEKLPEAKFQKLVNNDRGWDTTFLFLTGGDHIHQSGMGNVCNVSHDSENAALKKEIEMLRHQLEDVVQTNKEYWAMIKDLMKK